VLLSLRGSSAAFVKKAEGAIPVSLNLGLALRAERIGCSYAQVGIRLAVTALRNVRIGTRLISVVF